MTDDAAEEPTSRWLNFCRQCDALIEGEPAPGEPVQPCGHTAGWYGRLES